MSYIIRLIEEKDNLDLAKIIRASLEEFGNAVEGTVYFDDATDRMFKEYQRDRSVYFVVEESGKVLGGSGIGEVLEGDYDYCELQKMYLSPRARGKGIGSALMEKCILAAKELGCKFIYLESFENMLPAIKLYEKYGFKTIDKPLGNTGHSSCDVWMLKKI